MGLLDKVKGKVFDEEEVEIPEIKKEPKNIIKKENNINLEETNPIKEIKVPKDDFSDKENYKSESTFTFPIDFEDDEPIIQEKPKYRVEEKKYEPKRQEIKKETRDYSDFLIRKDEKKHFKPTPIISPVYGILDQNYKKEDVIVKKDVLRRPNELSLEEVRKRAFGTLEEELEQTLTGEIETDKVVKLKENLEQKKEKSEVIVEKPVDKKKTIGELIEEESINIEIPELDSIKDEEVEYNSNGVNDIDEKPTNTIEDLLNHEEKKSKETNDVIEDNNSDDEIDEDEADLFTLIDSMYEEKGE